MSSILLRSPELEIAHVLFMDLVGYSLLAVDQQQQRQAELQEVVRATNEFQRAEFSGELISIPTGDGMALVFLRNPLAPVQCALEVAQFLRERPLLQLRMGVHSGIVYRVSDINGNPNVSGEGINFAQRVMDCGDAGHILLSADVAKWLHSLESWSDCLIDLKETSVKHGLRLHIYNLVKGNLGNRAVPAKIRAVPPRVEIVHAPSEQDYALLYPRDSTSPPSELPQNSVQPTPAPSRVPVVEPVPVAILYKRNAQPDGEVLKLLEARLSENGCKVFIDRHMTIGTKWVEEIERQVCGAEAVIPLLSAASAQSDMLAWEVETAFKAAQNNRGTPRLLPVRIHFHGPIEGDLADLLNPVQHTHWDGPADNDRLVEELLKAIHNPVVSVSEELKDRLESDSGAVALDSKFWVVRPIEATFRSAIARRDSIVLVKGARQMGKTSLLARGGQQVRGADALWIRTDYQKLNNAQLATVDAFFFALAELIADQLNLDVFPEEVWNERRGANINFERYIRREVLGKTTRPIVWAMDEVDRLFTCDFGSDVFALFRTWHNDRSLDPDGAWSRLTLLIAYATEAHLFITDPNQSPFNVGTRLSLEDFTLDQVADLNRRHGAPLRNMDEVQRFQQLLGGQPYLVRRGLNTMVAREMSFADFAAEAVLDEGLFSDHLRRFLVLLIRDERMCEAVRDVLRGSSCPDATRFYRLRSAGILSGNSYRDAQLRCQLYGTYLERHLL